MTEHYENKLWDVDKAQAWTDRAVLTVLEDHELLDKLKTNLKDWFLETAEQMVTNSPMQGIVADSGGPAMSFLITSTELFKATTDAMLIGLYLGTHGVDAQPDVDHDIVERLVEEHIENCPECQQQVKEHKVDNIMDFLTSGHKYHE